MIGETGLKHLGSTGKQAVQMLFEVSHSDAKYYEKMAQVYIKANEAVGQAYIDYHSLDSTIIVSQGALEMKSIEKLELWTKAELDDMDQTKWPEIATEINSLLSGCSAEEVVNLNCSPHSTLLDNLIV